MNFISKVVEKIKFQFPPSKTWKYEKQTNPPTFGWAKFCNQRELDHEVKKRKDHCLKVIKDSDLNNADITFFILTCKRWETLEPLVKSCKNYFENIDKYKNIKKVLIDNDSGEEILKKAEDEKFFDDIIKNKENLGMIGALQEAFSKVETEFIIFVEDDFLLDCKEPFLKKCIDVFREFPEIGFIRLKNQNNWWKPFRRISPLRSTSSGVSFWTWLPSLNGRLNGWCAGSVMFRTDSFKDVGDLPKVSHNISREKGMHQGELYECEYGEKYNRKWLTAKIENCYPFVQPNDNEECLGWGDKGE